MKQKLSNLWGKDGTKSVLASLISILIGMVVGALIIIIVGAANPSLGAEQRVGGHPPGVRRPVQHRTRRGGHADLRL